MFKKSRHNGMSDAELSNQIELGRRFADESHRDGDKVRAAEFEEALQEDETYRDHRNRLRTLRNL